MARRRDALLPHRRRDHHRVAGGVGGRNQLFRAGAAFRIADPARERDGQSEGAGAGFRRARALHDRTFPINCGGA